MARMDEILEFNKHFVDEKKYEDFKATRYPNKKIAVLSCMDTRLTELLPAALNLKNGDAKIIKNAGAVISHPFGSVMRSLLVAVYELGVDEILVVGHTDCGMQSMDSGKLIGKMLERNISQESIDMVKYYGVDLDKWLKGFDDVNTSVIETVSTIKKHPLIPENVNVYGLVINPETGELRKI
jgi:carbonic anhydrase